MEEALLAFIESAIEEKTNQLRKIVLHVLGPDEAERLIKLSGLDLIDFQRVIDNFGVRHAIKKHGNEYQESLRGQIAVEPSDFLLIFTIIVEYDEISMELNRIGNIIFRYKKEFDAFRLVFAEEVRLGRREIAFQTLYKQKIRKT